jgi:hypothetical protein
MGQYKKGVKVTEPAEGLMGFPVMCHFLKIIHEKLTVRGDNGEPTVTVTMFIELANETEKGRSGHDGGVS